MAALLFCATACRGSATPSASPEPRSGETAADTMSEPASPTSDAAALRSPLLPHARAFVHALAKADVDALATEVAFPVSFRQRRGESSCVDAASAGELAGWLACVHESIGHALHARHALETLDIGVYASRSQVREDALAKLSDAAEDDVFVRASMFGSPTNLTLVLVYPKHPSPAVRAVWAALTVELEASE